MPRTRSLLAAAVVAALLAGTCGESGPSREDASGGALPPEQNASTFAITRYAFRFDLISARMETELTVELGGDGGNCVTLESALPLETPPLWGSAAGRVSRDGERLRICSDRLPQKGTVRITTTSIVREGRDPTTFQVGYFKQADRDGHLVTELVSWLGGCRLFSPCETGLAPQVEIDVMVSHAPDVTVLCAGTREIVATGTHCRIGGAERAPLYSGLTIAAHPAYARNDWLDGPTGRIVLFEPAPGRLASALNRDSARAALDFMTGLLGPLPYGAELRVGVVPLGWMGFEPPANLLLDDRLPEWSMWDYARPAQHTLVHELAHQWAGDRVTMVHPRDVLWKEAIAEYLAYLIEEQQGAPGEAAVTRRGWQRSAQLASWWPLALDADVPANVLAANAVAVGPMTLFVQLEPYVGRAALLAALRDFLAVPGARTTADLRAAIERASGVPLATYWVTWIEGSGEPVRPELDVQAEPDTVTITQMQAAAPLPIEIEVDLVGANRRVRVPVRFDLDAPLRAMTVPHGLGEPVLETTIDPDARALWLRWLNTDRWAAGERQGDRP